MQIGALGYLVSLQEGEMVAYEPQTRTPADISTMTTEVHGVRVFDTWSDDDLDVSLDQVDYRPGAPVPAAPRSGGGGWLRSLVMMMVGGVLGMGVVGVVMLALFVVGGVVAAGALLYTVPVVEVIAPAPVPDGSDADLVVMPDPGFKDGKPKKKK